jgi:hypothetical protein
MAQGIIFLLCVFLTVSNAKLVKPRDLIEEVEQELVELSRIIQSEIFVAHNRLQFARTDFITYDSNVLSTGAIAVQQEAETLVAQLNTIKDLSHAAGQDISSCTNVREEELEDLPGRYIEQMSECIGVVEKEAFGILDDAKYVIDISMNKVHEIEFHLKQCQGDLLCISPLVTEIQLNRVRLPQNIKAEVQAAESTLSTLELSTQACSEDRIAEYTVEGNAILQDITACVDRIIG